MWSNRKSINCDKQTPNLRGFDMGFVLENIQYVYIFYCWLLRPTIRDQVFKPAEALLYTNIKCIAASIWLLFFLQSLDWIGGIVCICWLKCQRNLSPSGLLLWFVLVNFLYFGYLLVDIWCHKGCLGDRICIFKVKELCHHFVLCDGKYMQINSGDYLIVLIWDFVILIFCLAENILILTVFYSWNSIINKRTNIK